MPALLLVRHGKSDWTAGTDDRDRPLAPRGRAAADTQGRALAALGLQPDRIWSSPATRAAHTAEILSRSAGWRAEIELIDGLYDTEAETVADLIAELDHGTGLVALVGHQPWCSELLEHLTGGRIEMVTASAALVKVPSWARLHAGELRLLLPPRLRLDRD